MSRIPYTNKVGETLGSIADPAAAYSLRALGGGDPMVARVRRSSDDAEKDFTASDMGSGSVANWVNEQLNLTSTLNPTPVGADATWVHTAIDDSNYDLEAINNSATKFLNLKNVVFKGNTKYRFAFDYTVISGTSNLSLKRSTPYQTIAISEGFNSIVLDLTDDSMIQFRCATGATFEASIRNLTVTAIESDGFVTTWYDQSGNDNHATQGTAASQPKIVDGGTLVSDGIDFDASNANFLVSPLSSNITGSISMFSVSTVDSIGYTVSLSNSTISSNYFAIQEGTTSSRVNPRNNTTGVSVSVSTTNLHKLTFGLTTSDTSTSIGSLGNNLVTTNQDYGDSFSGSDINQVLVGLLRSVSPTGYFDGRIQEIIIYDSDQSANRAAIETNINNYYDIY